MRKAISVSKGSIQVESHPGGREYQEDNFGIYADDKRLLLVVADGMGGHSRGDLASLWLVEGLKRAFQKERSVETIFVNSIKETVQRMQESGKDMGCTFTAALVEKKNRGYELSYTWVGDSRLYLAAPKSPGKPSDNARKIVEKDGINLWILTGDDSFLWGFYLNGELDIDQITRHPDKNQLEFSIHPGQARAPDIVKKRIRTVHLEQGDKIFLCTDGVWETYLSQSDILKDLNDAVQVNPISNHLKQAFTNNLLNDNATFVLARMQKDVFKRRCIYIDRFKIRRKRIGAVLMTIFVLFIFMLIFLALIGELDSFIESAKRIILDIQKK